MPYIAVAIGGFLGACVRYALQEWLGRPHGFPVATLAINLSGCLFLAWFYTITVERFSLHPQLRLGIGTGFVGAFTTFSALTVETWQLFRSGAWSMGLLYVFTSFAGGLTLAYAGYLIAARQARLSMSDRPGKGV